MLYKKSRTTFATIHKQNIGQIRSRSQQVVCVMGRYRPAGQRTGRGVRIGDYKIGRARVRQQSEGRTEQSQCYTGANYLREPESEFL